MVEGVKATCSGTSLKKASLQLLSIMNRKSRCTNARWTMRAPRAARLTMVIVWAPQAPQVRSPPLYVMLAHKALGADNSLHFSERSILSVAYGEPL